ncbi:MAG TPA: endonuclease III domain-containing protein [Elusimicrobiota bacterium]|nr:endonuclease III domain-containing protein [Elusimicrobiota bacterium]
MPHNTAKPPSRSPILANPSFALARLLYRRLLARLGPQFWWPAQSPWEMMVGAILTQNTAWTNVEKAIANLRRRRALMIGAMARMPRRRLERLIQPSGFFRQKARRLQTFARTLLDAPEIFQQLNGRRRAADPAALRGWLLSQHGIGPETADSILLYAGKYPSFVVDAYTRRVGQRIGLFQSSDYDDVKAFFEAALPRQADLYNEMHALLVVLAKRFCTKRRPACRECPARGLCRYGRAGTKGVP